jgi:outer membrane protein OmpA-like peptidoglycan-associated protein
LTSASTPLTATATTTACSTGVDGLLDADRDGLIDALDPDSDNDGLFDGTERGVSADLKPADTEVANGHFVADLDPSTKTDPTVQDTDGDGLADGVEDADRNGRDDEGETDASLADTDGDAMDDGLEQRAANPTNPELADTDGDGLLDGEEDANQDGRVSGSETDPNRADSDRGGAVDGVEVKRGSKPLDPSDDFEVRGGGGCAVTSGGWLLSLALVLLLARRRRAGLVGLLAAAAVTVPTQARAQTSVSTAIDVVRFKAGMGSQDFLNVESPTVAAHLRGFVDLHVGYADNPLILGVPGTSTTALRVVDDLTSFELTGGLALKDRAEVLVGLPVSVAKGQQSAALDPSLGANPLGFAVGDLRLGGKFAFFERGSAFNLGTSLTLGLPTGNTATLRGGGGVIISPRVLGEVDLTVLRFLVNAGVSLRTAQVRLLDLAVGHEFVWALGAEVPVYGEANRLSLLLTATGGVGLSVPSSASAAAAVPVDAMGGLKYLLGEHLALEVAIGGGLTRGWATPRFQAAVGISFIANPIKLPSKWVEPPPQAAPRDSGPQEGFASAATAPDQPPPPAVVAPAPTPTFVDSDHDGVADATDLCPGDKETINGLTDEDGCPDPGEGLVTIAGGTLKLKTRVSFLKGKATFTQGTAALLSQLAATLRARPSLRVRFEVFVTELASRDQNEALAGLRAKALTDLFEAKGVNPALQVDARALGMQRPFDSSSVEVTTF